MPTDYAGNTIVTARNVGTLAATTQTFSDWVGNTDFDDYYQFTLGATSNLSVNLTGMSTDADVVVYAADSTTVVGISSNISIPNQAMNINNLVAGNYYVHVFPGITGVQTNYNLSLAVLPVAPLDNAGNSLAAPRDIGTLTTTAQTFSDWVGSTDSNEYYRFTLNGIRDLRLNLTGMSADANLIVYAANGTTIMGSGTDIGTNSEAVSINNLSAGTYYVRVFPVVTGTQTNYNLSFAALPTDNAGNTIATARSVGTLTANTWTCSDWIGSTDSNDYYRFTLNATSNLSLSLNGMSANADVIVYAANGTTVRGSGTNTGNSNEAVSINNLAAGAYYVQVFPQSGSSTNYNLSMVAWAVGSDDVINNLATTGQIAVGSAVTGVINSGVDQDWFRVSLAAGQLIVVDLEGSSTGRGTLDDPYIRGIYNSNAALLPNTSNDNGGGNYNAQVTFTASSDGDYYIAAGGNNSTGSYRLSVRDDFANNPTTTGQVIVGDSVTGVVDSGADQDWFRINLVAGQQIVVDLEDVQGTLDAYIRGIYNSSGTLLPNTSNDNNGWNYNSQVTFTAGNAGDYYIAAGGNNNAGSYRLTVSDDFANNITSTGLVTVGNSVTGFINSPVDQDWFRISLVAGQQIVVDLGSATSQDTLEDPYIRGVYNSSGTLLPNTSNDNNGWAYVYNSQVTFTAASAGDYYIAAGGNNSAGSYLLSVSDYFANNITTTGQVTVGNAVTGVIESVVDQDWFRISLVAGQQIVVDLEDSSTGQGTLGDAYIRGIYNSSGTLLPNTTDDNSGGDYNAQVTFTAASVGDYYIAAGGNNSDGSYRLSVHDDFANNITSTGRVTVGNSVTGVVDSWVDQDWFRISLVAGQQIVVDLDGSGNGQGTLDDPYIRGIYNSSGTLVSGTTNDNGNVDYNAQVTFTAAGAGDYYIAAGGNNSVGTYQLSVHDNFANNITSTGLVTVGGAVTGVVDSWVDQDWFRISLVAGQQIVVDLEGSSTRRGTLGNPYVRGIYNSSGTLVSNTTDDDTGVNGNAQVTFTAANAGNYYIAAGGNNSTGSYRLSVHDDFANNITSAGRVTVGGTVTGVVDSVVDQDWFRVSLVAGQQIVVDLEGSPTRRGTLGNPYIYGIYNSSGTLLLNTTDDDTGINGNSQVTFTAASAGNYYIAAGGNNSTGSYLLSVHDDFANNITSAGLVTVGGAVTGVVDSGVDQDWFRISLVAGQQIVVDLEGSSTRRGTLGNPYIYGIYNSSGTLLDNTTDDDGGIYGNSRVVFTAASAGNYYIGAGGYNTGSYRLSVSNTTGGAGNDILSGRPGNDILTGGAGADTFRFVTTVNSGIDTITDFQSGTDRIQIVSPNFANIPVGTLATNRLVAAGTTLTTGNAVFLYNGTTGGLSFDRDGNGSAAAVRIATLTGHPTLRATDFQVVAA